MMSKFIAILGSILFVTSANAEIVSIREATAVGPQANAQAGIQATIDAFRGDLGDPNNGNTVGSQESGRRQVTWDGGDNDSAPARMPRDFFNAVAPRGIVVQGLDARAQFQISADSSNPTTTDSEFGNINATYPTAFSVFSSPRLFSALNTNVYDVLFFVPGTDQPATVNGFGAVFTDVDIQGSSSLEFFDVKGNSIFSRSILASSGNGSLSFLGVKFDSSVIAKVRITAGTAPLGVNDVTQGGTQDIVVTDDFIYSEPVLTEVFHPLSIESLSAPLITTEGKSVKIDMQDVGSNLSYFIRSICRAKKDNRKIFSSRVGFAASTTIKKPKGKDCRYFYSVVGEGYESVLSPRAK